MSSRARLAGHVASVGHWQELVEAFSLLTKAERRRAVLLVLSMSLNAVMGLVGLAGIVPFVQLMMSDDPLAGNGLVARSMKALGVADANTALAVVGLALVVLVLAKNIYAFVHSGFQNRFCAAAETRMVSELLQRVTEAPYAWLVTKNSAILRDIVLGQTIEWSRGLVRPALQAINDLIFLLVVFGLLIAASPIPGLSTTLLCVFLAVALFRISRPRIARYAERKRQAIRVAGVIAWEAIAGGRDVRISQAGPFMLSKTLDDIREYSRCDAAGRQWQQLPRLGIEVIGFGALIGIALAALYTGASRAEVAALLALYAVVAVRAIPIVSQLVVGVTAMTGAMPAVAEIRALMAEMPMALAPGKIRFDGWSRLSLSQVRFTYAGVEKPALGPIDLDLVQGRAIGIVGLSGSGKSTLVDVIAGLLAPQSGQIAVDGMPLGAAELIAWQHQIAYVAQTPFILDATLRENIYFGKPLRPDDESRLRTVLAASGLAEVVAKLPSGLDTPLGERGTLLSGGQRQRVAIARALFREASLIIMDEATSALDSLTEREITEELDRLRGKITLVVVAHRLSTISRLDEIIVLDHGIVTGRGTHAELQRGNATYRRLVEAQSSLVEGAQDAR